MQRKTTQKNYPPRFRLENLSQGGLAGLQVATRLPEGTPTFSLASWAYLVLKKTKANF